MSLEKPRVFITDNTGSTEVTLSDPVIEHGHEIPLPPGTEARRSDDGRWFFVDRENNRICDVETGEWTQLDPNISPEEYISPNQASTDLK